MNTDFEFLGERCNREGDQSVRFKQGDRVLTLWCSLAFSKIEFFYHEIKKWDHPFDRELIAEADRARLAKKISDYYTNKGWNVIIDRRRFCPRLEQSYAAQSA